MTKFIAVVSAKGGVGKTTTTINLSSALEWFSRDVILVDGNFANPDVGIHLGTCMVEKTLHSALKGTHKIKDCLYRHPCGLKIIPGHISYYEARKAQRDNLLNVILELANTAEAVIIDSTPGLGGDARAVIKAADYILVVTTPDICSVINSLKMVKLSEEYSKHVLGIIINRVKGEEGELGVSNIEALTGAKVIGIIPDDESIRASMHKKNPVIYTHPESPASVGFKRLAARLIGEKYSETIDTPKGYKDILGRLGFAK